MAESSNPFARFEASLGHDFATLANRVHSSYNAIDILAHLNGSQHDDKELLFTEIYIDNLLRRVYCERTEYGIVLVKTEDAEGTIITYDECNVARQESTTESQGGKHAGFELPPGEHLSTDMPNRLTQLDKMIVVATTLEITHHAILTNGATVVAYDS